MVTTTFNERNTNFHDFVVDGIAITNFKKSLLAKNSPDDIASSDVYTAPETLISSWSKPGITSDIWGLAATIYTMRVGRNPFAMTHQIFFVRLRIESKLGMPKMSSSKKESACRPPKRRNWI
ncbi:hypothetical protein F4779DRAFT_581453 [Xylariaceae sp. FL0662B]|nr:hypothetical protein F4779DRAFT_581453 [Xylariaceae sp. FL0662B]